MVNHQIKAFCISFTKVSVRTRLVRFLLEIKPTVKLENVASTFLLSAAETSSADKDASFMIKTCFYQIPQHPLIYCPQNQAADLDTSAPYRPIASLAVFS